MKKQFLLFILILTSFQLRSQSLEKKIHKQVGFVISFNLKSLSQKINFNDLGNYSFMKKPDNTEILEPTSVVKELFRLPEKGGINKMDKIYIYSEKHDSIENLNYLIALSDVKLFQNRMVDILKSKKNEPKFIKEGSLKVMNYDHRMSIGVGKNYALLSIWKPVYFYADDYYLYEEERNKVRAMIDSIRYIYVPSDTDAVVQDFTDTIGAVVDTLQYEIPDDHVIYERVVSTGDYEYTDYSYDNDSLMKQFERRWVEIRRKSQEQFLVRQNRKMSIHQKYSASLSPQQSLMENKNVAQIFAHTDDIIYWFNYEDYTHHLIDVVTEKSYPKNALDKLGTSKKAENSPLNSLAALLKDNTMFGLGNFNKGEIKMNFYSIFNETLKPFIEKIYSNNINPEFFKYIRSDNLMGMVGMSINSEAAANLYYEIFRRATESSENPNKYLIAAMEMSDLFLDKNVIHHTFKGDAVIALTGIKSYIKTYTSYEYDSLTFENQTVEKTKTKYIPEFVSILTVENQDNLKRILNIVKRLDGLIELSKNIYIINSNYMDSDNSVYLVLKNNLLFITNDKTLATEQLTGGMESNRIVGDAYLKYLKNTSFGFWDADKMFKLMSEGAEEQFGKPDMIQRWSKIVNKGFFEVKPLNGNMADTEFVVEMKNRESSSLLELLKLFDDIFVLNGF